jgi:hypothetical protein
MPEKTAKEIYNEKTRVQTPWKPAKTLEVPDEFRDPNYAYRWLNPDPANLQRMIAEGFEIDTEISKKMPIPEGTLQLYAGKSIDGSTVRAGMVLGRIPKTVAKQMEDHYTREADARMPSIKGNVESTTADGHDIRIYDPFKGKDKNNIMK